MELTPLLLSIILSIGITLGVGSSTFALINFIVALQDGVIDDSEKRLMHVVYFVLRIGMVFIAIGLLGFLFLGGFSSLPGAQHLMALTLLAVITLNAILMTKRIMPMQYGPVIAGGSWYSLFFLTELPLYGTSYVMLLIYYGIFLVAFYFAFEAVKKKFLPPRPSV